MKIDKCKPWILLTNYTHEEDIDKVHGIYLGTIKLFNNRYLYEVFCIEYKRTYRYSKHEIEYLWKKV